MTPGHTIKGLIRDHLMPADSRIACSNYLTREVFDRYIEVSLHPGGNTSSKYRRRLEREAKEVCAGCPVRLQCLTVHGPDLSLGIVGGLTDVERGEMFGGAA